MRKPHTRRRTWPGSGNQASCGPVGVVLVSPSGRVRPGIPDAIEGLFCKELVSEASVEAFGVAVLPWAPRFDVEGAHAYGTQPVTQRIASLLARRAVDLHVHWIRISKAGRQLFGLPSRQLCVRMPRVRGQPRRSQAAGRARPRLARRLGASIKVRRTSTRNQKSREPVSNSARHVNADMHPRRFSESALRRPERKRPG
jgi:hypothetical protein